MNDTDRPPFREARPVLIRDVRTILTAPEGVRLVIVKVETSEPGLYGLGCATFCQRPLAVAAAVDEYLRPFLIGRDVRGIEDLWHAARLSSYWRDGPVLNNALGGVDMALWDILGKRCGMPVWALFGGKTRSKATVYVHATGRDPAEVSERASAYIENGFTHVRCQVAIPGLTAYGTAADSTQRYERVWEERPYLKTVIALFERLRDDLGFDVDLLHDVHERLSPPAALSLAKRLEPYDLFFLEDALAPEDADHFRRLRAQTAVPLAMGELFTRMDQFVPLVKDRLIDFVRAHVSTIGGLTPALKLAHLCDTFGVRTAWHGPRDASPVAHAANLALDVSMTNFGIQEFPGFSEPLQEVFPGCPVVRDGAMWPSDSPGLGVDIDERAAAKHPFPADKLGGGWTEVRRRDGSVVRP